MWTLQFYFRCSCRGEAEEGDADGEGACHHFTSDDGAKEIKCFAALHASMGVTGSQEFVGRDNPPSPFLYTQWLEIVAAVICIMTTPAQ